MRENLIKLFLSMNPWGCFIMGQDGECDACQSKAEEMADSVLEVMSSTDTAFTSGLAEAIAPALDEYTESELVAAIEQVVHPILNNVHEDRLTIANIPAISTLIGERWGHEYAVLVYRLDA